MAKRYPSQMESHAEALQGIYVRRNRKYFASLFRLPRVSSGVMHDTEIQCKNFEAMNTNGHIHQQYMVGITGDIK